MKNRFLSISMVFAALCFFSFSAAAQIRTPALSPSATLTQQVGLTEISISYSRPSARGRKIFGDLLSYGEMWRTGANAATKISFSDAVTVEGNKVPAGEYALYTIPGKEEWTIILHGNTEYWGTGGESYKKEEEVVRFMVKPITLDTPVETFTISISDLTLTAANIVLKWENTAVKFKVETEVDKKVMADIDRYITNMARNNANMYFQAASYYYEAGKDLAQALEWVSKAVEANPEAYYMSHLKAKILAKQNNKKAAIATAEASIKAAEAANNKDYIRLNEDLIEDLKSKK